MLGEVSMGIRDAEAKLSRLREERELLKLWGEDNLHPFVLKQKLEGYDKEIEKWETMLDSLTDEYDEIIDSEVDALMAGDEDDDDPFRKEFEELCCIDGVRHPHSPED